MTGTVIFDCREEVHAFSRIKVHRALAFVLYGLGVVGILIRSVNKPIERHFKLEEATLNERREPAYMTGCTKMPSSIYLLLI